MPAEIVLTTGVMIRISRRPSSSSIRSLRLPPPPPTPSAAPAPLAVRPIRAVIIPVRGPPGLPQPLALPLRPLLRELDARLQPGQIPVLAELRVRAVGTVPAAGAEAGQVAGAERPADVQLRAAGAERAEAVLVVWTRLAPPQRVRVLEGAVVAAVARQVLDPARAFRVGAAGGRC